jgi:hypothetical protein
MLSNLYLSCPVFVCFDADADAAAALEAEKAAAEKAAADKATNGDDPNRKFTQAELNKIVAADRRKLEALVAKHEKELEAVKASAGLTEQEKTRLELALEDVRKERMTKEQQLAFEKKKIEETLGTELNTYKTNYAKLEKSYHEEIIDRDLLDAAVSGESFQPSQIVTLLKQNARRKEIVREDGKPTGKYETVIDFADVSEEGVPMASLFTPKEAIARMKQLPDIYGNLFKAGVVSGIGGTSSTGFAPGANGLIDARKLTTAQYREIREKTPERLGLAPKRR